MMIALLAELASMSALLKRYLKATFIKSIRMYAPTVVLVQMFALLRLFILNKIAILRKIDVGTQDFVSLLLFLGIIFCPLQN
jgi:hypothetical protein